MQRERLGSRLGFILLSAGLRHWDRECLEIPLHGGTKRWRCIRADLPVFLAGPGNSCHDH